MAVRTKGTNITIHLLAVFALIIAFGIYAYSQPRTNQAQLAPTEPGIAQQTFQLSTYLIITSLILITIAVAILIFIITSRRKTIQGYDTRLIRKEPFASLPKQPRYNLK